MKKNTVLNTAFDEYTIIKKIGAGGNGEVYKASNHDSEYCAIKVIDKSKQDKKKVKRFKNELYFSLINSHTNIVKVIDYGLHYENDKMFIFYVMPLYKASLRKYISEGISPQDAISIFIQIADGLEYAHKKNIIHRDIKPENILMNSPKDVVIADFGIAHFEKEEMVTSVETQLSERLANYKYCAPEQKERTSEIDSTVDIFALGLILNEMFTSKVPHGSNFPNIKSINQSYGYLDDLVGQMIQHYADQRIQPISKVKIDLLARIDDKNVDDELKKAIEQKIDESEIKDILIIEPPKIINARLDNNTLVFELDNKVDGSWAQWFNNPGSHSWYGGYKPRRFMIKGNKISVILLDEYNNNDATQIKNTLEGWIKSANIRYKQTVENKHKEQIEKALQAKKTEIDRLEKLKMANNDLSELFK